MRSALNLSSLELGFRVEQIMTFMVEVPAYRYPDLERVDDAHLRILEKLRELPGVQSAGIGTRAPTAGSRNNHSEQLIIQGRERIPGRDGDFGVDMAVSPEYFDTLGIPLLKGRAFNPETRLVVSPWL